MELYMLHPLQSRDDITAFPGIGASRSITLSGIKNGYTSFQMVLNHEEDFEIYGVEITGCGEIRASYHFGEDVVFEDGRYPDILSNEKTWEAKAGSFQPIWVTIYVGKDAGAGEYDIAIKILTSAGEQEASCRLKVFDVTLPDAREGSFLTEYWVHVVNSWFRWPDSDSFDCIKYYFGCEKYSEKWWEINGAMARNMKESRVNVLFVRTMDLLFDGGTTVDKEGRVDFQWGLFDRWIDFYLDKGDFQKLAGMHLVMQTEGRQVFVIRRGENGCPVLGLAREESEEARRWTEQYLPALYQHLGEKGYRGMWIQHVQDEPMDADSWLKMIPYVRKHMPGILTLDAFDNQSPAPELQGRIDLWIPRVDIYEENREFYDFRLAEGDKRWVYTCCLPQEMNYANKFIDRPLIHNRVIGWGCFVNHFTGFLHWGYDFWDPEGDMFGLNPKAQVKGDGFIIYPDREHGTIKNSVRMIATRDSAQDYELLHMLAEREPDMAYGLAKKVIRRFNDFNWNPLQLEEVRTEVLRALERSNK